MSLVNIFTIDLDLKRKNYISEPVVTSNDSVRFVVNVTDDGLTVDLSTITLCTLAHTRPDGIVVVKAGSKTGPSQVSFDLGSTETLVPGSVDAKVQLYEASGRISTLDVSYTVTKDPSGSSFVPSEDDQTLIEIVIGQGPQIIANAQTATTNANAAATNANTVASNVQTAENIRVSSESTRVSNENTRQSNETTRKNNETTRVSNEVVRQSQETTRQNDTTAALIDISATETSVQNAENVRINSESARVSAEGNRVTAESNRAGAETTRVSAESLRQGNESTRSTAETARSTAETARSSAETARSTAETSRASVEGNRVTAESNRAGAETTRASAETARSTAETARSSAETARSTAETSRASVEGNRVTAESNRAGAETTRASAETARQGNESTRSTAETARSTAETNRGSAESSRVSVESSRVTAENGRAGAETTRVTAESNRVSAESSRASAEGSRASNETTRQGNEANRITNTNNALADMDVAVLTTQKIYKPYVDVYADIATTYPTPSIGWTVQAADTKAYYRYDGVIWVEIGIGDTTIGDVEVDDTMTPTTTPNPINIVLSFFGNMIRKITGKSSWITPPAINLETVSTYLNQAVRTTNSPSFLGLALSGALSFGSASRILLATTFLYFNGGTAGYRYANNANDAVLMELSNTGVLTVPGSAAIGSSILAGPNSSQVLSLKGGTSDFVVMGLYARAVSQAVRSGYIGYAAAASNDLRIANEINGGHIILSPGGSGGVVTTASQILSTLPQGTAPIAVVSTTEVASLNSGMLQGNRAAAFMRVGNVITDADALVVSGFYSTGAVFTGSPIVGSDGSNQGYLEHASWSTNSSYSMQTFTPINAAAGIFKRFRIKNNGVWGNWVTMWDANNHNSTGDPHTQYALRSNVNQGVKTTDSPAFVGVTATGNVNITGKLKAGRLVIPTLASDPASPEVGESWLII